MSASSLFYRVEDIWVPEDLQGQCTKTNVFLKDEWWTLAAREAALKDLSVIGDIHSHPARYKGRPDCAPSEDDWHNNLPGHFIHGVCVVQKLANGNLRATTRLWPVIHLPEMWVA
jgi:proteasome lid subunit RPN8/RPN11